ncbi:hypothetical protein XENOCAPTIV_016120 [Xenoophorus captivus]|uniref:Uncharacterized protein n=1 Tax=Xenoophorus captivus TaxID=1517983 RepID=A0ABV0QM42_9TELE
MRDGNVFQHDGNIFRRITRKKPPSGQKQTLIFEEKPEQLMMGSERQKGVQASSLKSDALDHTCQVLDLKIREIFWGPQRTIPRPRPTSSIPCILAQVYKISKITTCQPLTEYNKVIRI